VPSVRFIIREREAAPKFEHASSSYDVPAEFSVMDRPR
jgi:hypothetical protein